MDDFVTYLIAATQNIPQLQNALFLIAGVVGVFYVITSLIGLGLQSRGMQSRSGAGVGAHVMGIVMGSLLLSLTLLMDIVSVSYLAAAADPQIISSYTPTNGTNVEVALQSLTVIINFMGWIALFKGVTVWRNGPIFNNPGWFWNGFIFIFFGSICANFVVFADVLGVSVGAQPIGTNYFSF